MSTARRRGAPVLTLLAAACGGAVVVSPGSGTSSATGSGTDEITASASTGSSSTGSGSAECTGSSTGGDTGSSTGGVTPVAPSFLDIAESAGVHYVQGPANMGPNCIVADIITMKGNFCSPEWMAGGAAVVDYDDDGFTDLYVTRLGAADHLFRNRGDGTLEDVAAEAGLALDLYTNGAVWGDIDNDGDPDLYLSTIADTRYYLFVNDGTGHFSEEALARGAALESPNVHTGTTPTFGDYDLDGDLDLYVGEWRTFGGLGMVQSHARLLQNQGDGTFVDVTDAAGVSIEDVPPHEGAAVGVYAFAPAFVDLDRDRWPELVLTSDFQTSRLFWNNGDGTFTDGTVAAGVGTDRNGMGSTFGDVDGDGDLDWFIAAAELPTMPEVPGNRLFRQDANRTFTDVTVEAGVAKGHWGWGAVFMDHDNDGDLDLAQTNGWLYSTNLADPMRFWDNPGTFPMLERSFELGLENIDQGRGLLTFDHDNDGYLDIFTTTYASTPRLYENQAEHWNDWLRVRAIGTTSNRDGVGARVTVQATAGGPVQVREIGSQSYYLGQSERIAHFGLGSLDGPPVYRVEVYWPASDTTDVREGVPRNELLVVTEGG